MVPRDHVRGCCRISVPSPRSVITGSRSSPSRRKMTPGPITTASRYSRAELSVRNGPATAAHAGGPGERCSSGSCRPPARRVQGAQRASCCRGHAHAVRNDLPTWSRALVLPILPPIAQACARRQARWLAPCRGLPGRNPGSSTGRSRRRRCRHLAGQWFRPGVVPESRREEDLTMSDRAPAPGSSGNDLSGKSDRLDEAREAALMREIIRA